MILADGLEGGNGAIIQASHGCKPVGVSVANVITHSPTDEQNVRPVHAHG